MIRARCGLRETDDEADDPGQGRRDGRHTVPDEQERRWIEPALLALLGVETGVAPEQLVGAWRTFFERLAATAPVVLVFEDFHYADSGLIDFVDHILEWSRGLPDLRRHARPAGAARAADRLGRRQAQLHLDLPRAAARSRDARDARRPRARPARDRRQGDHRPGRRDPALRGRDDPDAPGRGQARAQGRRLRPGRRPDLTRRPGDADRPDRRPPRWPAARGSGADPGRGGPRPELHPGCPRRGQRPGRGGDRAADAGPGQARAAHRRQRPAHRPSAASTPSSRR